MLVFEDSANFYWDYPFQFRFVCQYFSTFLEYGPAFWWFLNVLQLVFITNHFFWSFFTNFLLFIVLAAVVETRHLISNAIWFSGFSNGYKDAKSVELGGIIRMELVARFKLFTSCSFHFFFRDLKFSYSELFLSAICFYSALNNILDK